MLQGMLRQTDDGVEAGALYAEDAFLDHRAVTVQCTVVVDSVRQMLRLLLACALAVVSDAVYAKAAVNVAVNTLAIIADFACVVFVCCHCR